MDWGSSTSPSASDFKTRVCEAEDMVVLVLSETVWIAIDTKSHIWEQRTWPCLVCLHRLTRAGCCSPLAAKVMLAVCTVFSIYKRPHFWSIHTDWSVGKLGRTRIVFSKEGGALEAACFWSMNTPSLPGNQNYWHEMVIPLFTFACAPHSEREEQLHISFSWNLGVAFVSFKHRMRKHPSCEVFGPRGTDRFDFRIEEIATWLILPVAYACLKD